MTLWTRTASLEPQTPNGQETWTYAPNGRAARSFSLEVTTGKPLDVVGLKNTSLDDLRSYAATLAATADRLYLGDAALHPVSHCPCCHRATDDASEALQIFGVAYRRCASCGHAFVSPRPDERTANAVFAESDDHSQLYVDPDTLEVRLAQVIAPKLAWSLRVYETAVGGAPHDCLDVGAGGGHFVEGLRRHGVTAEGFELSRNSRAFAKRAFGLELSGDDFLTAPPSQCNLITMWGLLEYTPEPRKFLARARERLTPGDGLLVAEVPRFNAIGTVVQDMNPQSVARHMDPTSHLNCFSDASLATALVEEGFRPVAVWYFGLDAYELMVQVALRLGGQEAFVQLADMIPALQAACDAGRQCDDLIVAAIPQ